MDLKKHFLPELLHDIKKASQSYFNEELKSYNITSSQAFFLMLLNCNQLLSQKSLSNEAKCDKAHTYRIIYQLVENGLVEFEKSNIQRNQFVKLTEKGKIIARKFEEISKEWYQILTKGISEEELRITYNSTTKMINNATEYKKGAKK